ncbi:PopZ family protein [Aquibium oceanicum]|nr:DUF2497 domain-containing protein [Aquibium oceanicum]
MASPAAELKMPQTGGAQREPSMEEILASIRRIIEDSDQVRKPEPESAPFVAQSAPRKSEVEAFRREFDVPAASNGSDTAVPEVKAPEAEMRELPERAQPVEPEAEAAPETSATAEEPATEETANDESEAFADEPAIDLADDLLGTMTEEDEVHVPAAANSDAAAPSAAVSHSAEQQLVDKPSIISEHTGRQVAAAFGELSQAFMASRQRSFDDMAAEMMRPMLQDWLDNNLPTIVEKLVREEIERVARGS